MPKQLELFTLELVWRDWTWEVDLVLWDGSRYLQQIGSGYLPLNNALAMTAYLWEVGWLCG